jgi:hypothetical protein
LRRGLGGSSERYDVARLERSAFGDGGGEAGVDFGHILGAGALALEPHVGIGCHWVISLWDEKNRRPEERR